MSAHGRGYHVSRDPSCYGCGDPAQWKGHWCDQCKAPVKFPWNERAQAASADEGPEWKSLVLGQWAKT